MRSISDESILVSKQGAHGKGRCINDPGLQDMSGVSHSVTIKSYVCDHDRYE